MHTRLTMHHKICNNRSRNGIISDTYLVIRRDVIDSNNLKNTQNALKKLSKNIL